jgi:hypothetical protein
MTSISLKHRVELLESELARLKTKVDAVDTGEPQWRKIVGIFANDPEFAEAMRLGRKYRESLRPASRKRRKR